MGGRGQREGHRDTFKWGSKNKTDAGISRETAAALVGVTGYQLEGDFFFFWKGFKGGTAGKGHRGSANPQGDPPMRGGVEGEDHELGEKAANLQGAN